MGIKARLAVLNFFQFYIWGAWLISLGSYMAGELNFTGFQIGSVYTTMGLASLFMPGLTGMIADRYFNAEKVLACCHLLSALSLLYASSCDNFVFFYIAMLLHAVFYMPTIALNNAVCYAVLESKTLSTVINFPPIRVWGTVGFVFAMWTIDLLGWSLTANQLYLSAAAGLLLSCYALTLPAVRPAGQVSVNNIVSWSGLNAFILFRQRRMAVFFIYAMLLGAALQITNAFGSPFLNDFKVAYPESFAVKHPNVLLSVSQISETLFILTIPFFLKRFGIKKIMLFSMLAWLMRFALFGLGNPGTGFWMLLLSMVIYGMAFDFFNVSGSLFVEKEADAAIRSGAQGVFMIMCNGIGAILGGYASGLVVDHFTIGNVKDWQSIWLTFSIYTLALAVSFPFVFKEKRS